MKVFCLSLLVLASFQVSAQNTTRIQLADLPYKKAEANPQQKEEIFKNIDSAIRSVSNGPVVLPRMVTVYMLKTYDNAFFYSLGNSLVTPYQLNFDGQTKHPKFTRGVELHEFGHSIFEVNFASVVRNNKNAQDIYNAYLRSKNIYAREGAIYIGNDISFELAEGTPDEQYVKVGYDLTKANFNQAMSSESTLINMASSMKYKFLAHNEFFADVFAVVLTRDPDVIRNALQFSSHVIGNQSDRSFSLRPGKRVLNSEAHKLLSLSRQYIYKYYLSNPEVKKKGNAWILKRTLESIRCVYDDSADFDKMIFNYSVGLTPQQRDRMFLEKSNEHLNRCIDQEFSR